MTFTQAALIVVAIAAVILGLVCYHLLSRLDLLERAVQGGMEPPSRRLGREEYEQRFRRAVARASLATEVEHGLVLVLGAESAAGNHQVAAALAQLPRGDGITAVAQDHSAATFLDDLDLSGLKRRPDDPELGIAITPFALVIDDRRVTAARALVSGADLVELVSRHT